MRRHVGRLVLTVVPLWLVAGGSMPPATAQERQGPKDAEPHGVIVSLASAPTVPGALVFVNVMFSNPAGAEVVELRQTLDVPLDKVRFSSATLGIAGLSARVVLNIEMQDQSGAKVEDGQVATRLTIRMTSPAPLEEGALLELQFRQVARKEERIRLKHAVEARSRTGTPVPDLTFGDAHVLITKDIGLAPPPIFGCFFYMH